MHFMDLAEVYTFAFITNEEVVDNDLLISVARQVILLILIWTVSQTWCYPEVNLFPVVLDQRVYCLFMFGRSSLQGRVLWRWVVYFVGRDFWGCHMVMMCHRLFPSQPDVPFWWMPLWLGFLCRLFGLWYFF